jgi:polysaccharide export outer membrane protein
MKCSHRILLAMIVLTLAIPALAQKATPKTKGQAVNAAVSNGGRDVSAPQSAAPAAAPATAANDSSYVIGATDELDISVWEQPDLSLRVPVRPDGMISLPLLNDLQAAGKTPMELRTLITDKLSTLVKDPQVTVVVIAINSQRVFVLGQVLKAGAYPFFPGMTVLQAITSAGGLGVFANEKKIVVMRTENGQQVRLPFNYKDVVRGLKSEQNIVLKPGDTVLVP